jgi:hypothetical protein
MAAERLTIGLIKELATQATMIWKAETAPMGMRNMPKNLAPTLVVPPTMALPTAETVSRQMMWILLSDVRSALQVTARAVSHVTNQTGTVSRRVWMRP